MTARAMLVVVLFVLCPLGIATWILASFTIGQSLAPTNTPLIGFAVALFAVMTAAYVLLVSPMTEKPGSHLGLCLVICGTGCVFVAVALQFYLASVSSENARRLADILSESVRNGRNITNVNINEPLPGSVEGVGYLALFLGVWLAAIGVRVAVGRAEKIAGPGAEERFAASSEPREPFGTSIRQEGP